MTLGDDSRIFYNKLGNNIRSYAQDRMLYIKTVDEVISSEAIQGGSMLDVGSGDGVRAAELAHKLHVNNLVMLDNSETMVEASSKFGDSRLISIEDFHDTCRFDVITCLWNVFGHVERKLDALHNMAVALRPNGLIFLDVNNRYNAVEYGWLNVLRNMWKDFCGCETTGYFTAKKFSYCSQVYLHSCCELDVIFPDAGLNVVSKYYINYRTGRFCGPLGGQILYILKGK
jgi:SAM-dependent methyltransferase